MSISAAVRVTSYLILSLITLIILLGVFFNSYFNEKIIEFAKDHVSKSTNNEYILTIDKLKINLYAQSVIINNLTIVPSKKSQGTQTKYIFKTKSLRIMGLSIISYIRGRNILIDKIEFEEPQISMFQGSDSINKNKINQLFLLEYKTNIYFLLSDVMFLKQG